MSETFGQAYRQETEEVQGGSIAPPPADVSRKSVAQASATGTVDSNFRSIGEPERERIDNDSAKIMSALLSVAGTAAEVITKEQNRKKALDGARMAGTEDGRVAIDGMADNVMSQIFGPTITQRAGQEQIVKDSTIALNGKLTNDSGTIGLKMSDGEWNAHVDKTIASQTDLYEDEEIKDMITGDFAKRLGTIQSGWIKKSTIYRQEAARESYAKNVDHTFTQVAGSIDSLDPQVAADAQQAVRDIAQRPAGMTEEAHRDQLVDSLTQQLAIGNIGVYNAFKASGAFSQLNQDQQDSLSSMESAYNAKNDVGYQAAIAAVNLKIKAVNPDGSPRFSPNELLTDLERIKAQNPEAFVALGMQKEIDGIMATQHVWDEKVAKTARQVTQVEGDPHGLVRTGSPVEVQAAYTTVLEGKIHDSLRADLQSKQDSTGITQNMELTAEDIRLGLYTSADSYKELWSRTNKPMDVIAAMGNDVYKGILNVQPEDPEDPQLMTHIRTLKTLYETDPNLFGKQFKENGVDMMSLFDEMDVRGRNPWQAVTAQATMRINLAKNGGKMPEQDEAYKASKDKWLGEETQKFYNNLQSKGLFNLGSQGVSTRITGTDWDEHNAPINESEITAELSRLYDLNILRYPDPSAAAARATRTLLQEGLQIGEAFIIGGAKANDKAVGGDVAAFVQGVSDDEDLNAVLVSRYGLPEGTNFVDQLRTARISADGTQIIGMIDAGNAGMVDFQVGVPKSRDQLLPTNEEKRATLVGDVMRYFRDVGREAYEMATTFSSPTDLNTPLADIGSTAESLLTKAATGRDSNADIGAETKLQNARRELAAFDSKEEQKANTYHGKHAVAQVELLLGRPLTYKERVVVTDEGYVNGLYPDTKGNLTGGVGQTGDYINMSFEETLAAHERRIQSDPKKLPDYATYPEWFQAEMLSADYRGDLGISIDTMALGRAGRWEEAAIEFLANDEYLHPDTPKHIKARMRRTAAAMTRYGQQL
jgi:hypothetical protein